MRATTVLLLLYLISCPLKALAWLPSSAPLRIDCGSSASQTDDQGLVWSPDEYFTNGTAKTVQPVVDDGVALANVDTTLRFWEVGDSCYKIPASPGRYLVRLSFAYNNFDNNYYNLLPLNQLPTLGVTINGYFVEGVTVQGLNVEGYYTDFIAFSNNPTIDICLVAIQSAPYINSIQVLPVDTDAYFASSTGTDVVLSNWVRINCGGSVLGPETQGDPGYRTWSSDVGSTSSDPYKKAKTKSAITIPSTWDVLHLPEGIFQTARKAGSSSLTTGYNFTRIFPVDPNNRFMVVLYFAEIEGAKVGERVMDVWVNGQWVYGVDVVDKAGGPDTALVLNLPQVQLGGDPNSPDGQWVGVLLFPAGGKTTYKPPMISGIEMYELIYGIQSIPTNPSTTEIRVDCGGRYNYTDAFGLIWSADTGYSAGLPSIVVDPGNSFETAKSLRYFPHPKKNCYTIPVPPSAYLIRAFFDYGNYDQLDNVPTFDVAIESTYVVKITPRSPGGFIDGLAFVKDGSAEVCVVGPADGAPTVITSLEVLQVNSSSYTIDQFSNPVGVIFFDYYRINCGGLEFGEGITPTIERGHRQWIGDNLNVSGISTKCVPFCTTVNLSPDITTVAGAEVAPNFYPLTLYRSARMATAGFSKNGSITYIFDTLDAGADLALYFHFAEILPGVKKGERVFSVTVNGLLVNTLDKVDLVGSYGMHVVFDTEHYLSLGPKETTVKVEMVADKGSQHGPIISGIELYRALQMGPACQPDTIAAMLTLRGSMNVGDEHNWQGDPCGLLPWSGVTCELDYTKSYFLVTAISLPSAGLSGSISDTIGTLTDLTSLNLSNNTLVGPIPNTVALLKQLTSIDLSLNQLNESIPEGISSLPNLHQLLLNNNTLMGTPKNLVPPPSGLTVNLDGNPYLCGAKGFPNCDKIVFPPPPGGISSFSLPPPAKKGKGGSSMGIIVGAVVGAVLLVGVGAAAWLFVVRRRRASHDLMNGESLQAERYPQF